MPFNFVDARLAARIDAAESRLSAAVAESSPGSVVVKMGRGAGVFARMGSPVNKVIGGGIESELDEVALERLEAVFDAHGEPCRVELATLARTETLAMLGARGYQVAGFENVLVRSLMTVDATGVVAGVEVKSGDDQTWQRVLVDGFAAPDGTGVVVDQHGREAIAQMMGDFARAAGFARFVAYVDGQPAGAATMRVDDGVALMCGATTLAPMRRRGVQGALLAARLGAARRAGCEIAVVTTTPGSQSQVNVMRSGFALGYARAILLRTPAAPVAAARA